MLTVETDPVAVEERLGSGRLACPGCSAVLARWGHARGRQVRDTDGGLWIVPRRARCTGCGATHVLLPVVLLVRRADTAAVIGAGLTAKATGAGHRLIAALLGRPPETVRGWLRRFAPGSRRSVRCSPGGVATWRPIRCCRGRPGRRGRMRSPRSCAAAAALGSRFVHRRGAGLAGRGRGLAARLLSPGWPVPDGRS